MVITTERESLMEFYSPIFRNMTSEELEAMTEASKTRELTYRKEDIILHAGDTVREIGIVQDGCVRIENIDLWGNRSILSSIPCGHVFAETYAISREPMMVDAVAATDCRILFLDADVLLDQRNVHESWYLKLLRNMVQISTQKNLVLSSRIFCTSAKTIRSRLFTYFSMLSVRSGSRTIQVPFDRQQMADYLNVERTALSKELGKMRDEGLIDFHKNTFHLHSLPDFPEE